METKGGEPKALKRMDAINNENHNNNIMNGSSNDAKNREDETGQDTCSDHTLTHEHNTITGTSNFISNYTTTHPCNQLLQLAARPLDPSLPAMQLLQKLTTRDSVVRQPGQSIQERPEVLQEPTVERSSNESVLFGGEHVRDAGALQGGNHTTPHSEPRRRGKGTRRGRGRRGRGRRGRGGRGGVVVEGLIRQEQELKEGREGCEIFVKEYNDHKEDQEILLRERDRVMRDLTVTRYPHLFDVQELEKTVGECVWIICEYGPELVVVGKRTKSLFLWYGAVNGQVSELGVSLLDFVQDVANWKNSS